MLKQILSFVITATLFGNFAFGMESSQATRTIEFKSAKLSSMDWKYSAKIPDLSTGYYNEHPCLLIRSEHNIALYSLDSLTRVDNVPINNYFCSSYRMDTRPAWPKSFHTVSINPLAYEMTCYYGFGITSGGREYQWPGCKGVKSVQFLSDQIVIVGYNDHSIKTINLQTLKVTPIGYHNAVSCVTPLSTTKFVSGSSEGSIKIWDLETENVTVISGEACRIISLLSLNDNTLVIGSDHNVDSNYPHQGTIIDLQNDSFVPCFNYFGNIAKLNEQEIVYRKNRESLTFVVYNINTRESVEVTPCNFSEAPEDDIDISKGLLTTHDNCIIFVLPKMILMSEPYQAISL